MMQTEKFRFIRYKEINPIYQVLVYNEIWRALAALVFEYPNFKGWYRNLFHKDYTLKADRDILMCYYKQKIAGIAILKNTVEEKKICTLRVGVEYRNNGIGKRLMRESLEILEEEKPMITVRKSKSLEFEALFRHYGFVLEQDLRGYYRIFSSEMVYNGSLPQKDMRLYRECLMPGFLNWVREKGFRIRDAVDISMMLQDVERYTQQYIKPWYMSKSCCKALASCSDFM